VWHQHQYYTMQIAVPSIAVSPLHSAWKISCKYSLYALMSRHSKYIIFLFYKYVPSASMRYMVYNKLYHLPQASFDNGWSRWRWRRMMAWTQYLPIFNSVRMSKLVHKRIELPLELYDIDRPLIICLMWNAWPANVTNMSVMDHRRSR
jgi:hypothetical protein